MDQRLILPILLPLIAGIVLLLTNGMARQRRLSITAVAALLPLAAAPVSYTHLGIEA